MSIKLLPKILILISLLFFTKAIKADNFGPCDPQPASTSSQIASGADDVEEAQTSGTIYNNSSDLELVYDTYQSAGNQYVGMLFRNLNIPQGATITNAYIQFTVDETDSGTTSLTIAAHDSDDAPAFSTNAYDVSSRTRTTNTAAWSPSAWTSVGTAGTSQQTSNIASVVQEVVNRTGWTTASKLAIIITGTGTRTAESYNGSPSQAATIHIDYTLPGTGGNTTDSDGDGVCDAGDVCPGGDDNLDADNDGTPDDCDSCNDILYAAGTSCDDGDPCTSNDVYDNNCNCVGTLPSNDEPIQWSGNSTSYTVEVYECNPNLTNMGSFNLQDYNLSAGPITTQISDDLSALTYNPLTNSLFAAINGTPTIYELNLNGTVIRTINLNGFDDTEGLVWIGGNDYIIIEERRRRAVKITIGGTTNSISYPSNYMQLPGATGDNLGLEGVSYNPATNELIIVKEKSPLTLYSFVVPANYSSPISVNYPFNIATNNFNLTDLSGLHHLGLNSGLCEMNVDDHFLVLSHESRALIETDASGFEYSGLNLGSGGANGTLSSALAQAEGVTVDNQGNIYVVSEPNTFYRFTNPNIDLTPQNNTTLVYSTNISTTTNSLTIPGNALAANTTYCWSAQDNNSNSCPQSGVFTTGQGTIADADGDGVCDAGDICPYGDDNIDSDNDGTPDACDTSTGCTYTAGTPCDDNDPCTTGDVYDTNCNCAGTFADADADGVCDANDICPNGNDNIDTDNDGTPDDCDNNATNDSDGDGVIDPLDICPGGDDNTDTDNDGIPDFCDCETTQNSAISYFITNGNDDAEENQANGAMNLTSTDLDMVADGNSFYSGLLFRNIPIPQGATITSANIQFTADEADSGTSNIIIHAEDTNNAASFTASNFNISSRTTTSASVSWSPPAWTIGASGSDQKTTDISAVIQEVINRGGWNSGNDLAIIISGSGTRTAESYNGSVAQAPRLNVNYATPVNTSCDADGDGVNDNVDVCPGGDDNIDADNDGVPDFCDICANGDDNIDTDNDGTPDACDTCNGTLAGTTCNDNDACTTGDVYDANCNCAGTFADADADGVCDTNDICPNGDDNLDGDNDGTPDACDTCDGTLAGTTCDDNDACTTGDVYDANCNCAGTFADADADGVCDNDDICPNGNDNLDGDNDGTPDACDTCDGTLAGTTCDDNDACTTGDVYDANCNCAGTFADADADGVCDNDDICPNGNDNLDGDNDGTPDACDTCDGTLAGTTCNDNDACTTNDVYDSNCNCAGTFADTDGDGVCDINDICPNGNDNIDTDNDGTPDACDTCDGTLAGTTCNDNDACTTNDVYDSNCNCAGTFADTDGDGVCDINDICTNGNDNIDTDNDGTPDDCDTCDGTLAGTTCNDNDACTTNDVYDANCNCAGTFADADADGVCDANDICAAGDDNIDTDNNGTPDACDSNCATTESFSTNSRISSGNDDVEERQTGGTVYNSSSDLELVYDTYQSAGNQYVGMLFRNLNIPQGATITNAYVQFTVDETDTGTTSLSIAAQDADNAASFSTSNYNVSNRMLTTANVAWSPPAWTSVGAAGAGQQTPDISSVVQELVNRPGWASNSNLALIIKGTGTRTAESYDGSPSNAPIIYVDYTVSSTGSGDADGDGVCDVDDICPNGDDNLDTDNDGTPDACDTCDGTLAGTTCNDNDACTTGDVYDSNCNCAGTFADADGDGVCDMNDVCPNGNDNIDTDNDGTPDDCDTCNGNLAGTPCDDGDSCTLGDVYDANCNCVVGTYTDTDGDGVCDAEDICAAGDDNIDTDNNGTPDACDSNCIPTQAFSTNSRISSGNDDVEERQSGGTVYTTSSDLELVYDTYQSSGNQYVGMLFRNLNIPQGATITNAYVQFTADETDTGAISLSIAAQDADNAASFSTSNYNVSNRMLTTANVAWSPPAWTSVGAAGAGQQTPDISSIVQELVNRPGWASNSNLALIITGTGSRTAESYNGSPSKAPIIYVDYTVTSTGTIDIDGDGYCDNPLIYNDENNDGIEEQTTQMLKVYPNPADRYIKMDLSDILDDNYNTETAFVALYSAEGKPVYVQEMTAAQIIEIDIRNLLSNRPYFVKVQVNGKILSNKFVKLNDD